jgi:hypothetical protein
MCYLHETTTKRKACQGQQKKANLTEKLLWNFEPNYQQNWNRLKQKSRGFAGMI